MNKISLPKIDLHCHLDGSLTKLCLETLLQKELSKNDLQVSENCQNLTEYLEKFNLPLRALQTETSLEFASYKFIEEVSKENIKYIEVRFAPALHLNNSLNIPRVIESVLRGLERGKQAFDVNYGLIICLMRHHSDLLNRSVAQYANCFADYGVCAIDLAGDESKFPMQNFQALFKTISKSELPFIAHAGECGNVQNIVNSVNYGAVRIGHGIAMSNNKEVQELCKRKNVAVEMCPISNIQTKASNILEYPIQEFLNNGLLVTINTDNRTVSGTSITKEIEFIQKNYKVTDEQVLTLMRNAVKGSFMDNEAKVKFLTSLEEPK